MLDKRQARIFNNILDKFKLPYKNITFIQHRNLTEFKYFQIEKINPTHHIILYGSLKNNNKKKETSKTLLKVGEILIGSIVMFINLKTITDNLNLIIMLSSILFLDSIYIWLLVNVNIWSVLKRLLVSKVFSEMVKQFIW